MPRGGVERTTKRRLVYKATDLVPHRWPYLASQRAGLEHMPRGSAY